MPNRSPVPRRSRLPRPGSAPSNPAPLRRLLAGLLSGFVLVLVTGCTEPQTLRKLRVGHLIALDMAPHFVAQEAGYFREQGLDVELAAFGPYQNDAQLASGELDISITPFTLPYIALQKGVPVRVVGSAGGWGVLQVVIQGSSGVASLPALAEQVRANPRKLRVGTLRGDTVDLILLDAFRDHGLSYADFEMVWIDSIFELVEAFKRGEIDVLGHIKPYTTDLIENHGARLLADSAGVWHPAAPNCVIAVLDDLLVREPEVVEAYLKAVLRAAALINRDPAAAVALLRDADYPNYFKVPHEVTLAALRSQPAPISLTPDMSTIDAVMFSMAQEGYIEKYVPGRNLFRLDLIRRLESG